jgi:dipeptidase E
MKFYFSSFAIGDEPEKLKNLLGENKKAVYISNALDRYNNNERAQNRMAKDIEELEGIGVSVESLDLREYFGKKEELARKLGEVGLIWSSGGNVYDLRIAMKLSGFDEVIKDLLDKDIVFGGYSASVCVLSPTLKGYHIVDSTEGNPYGEEVIWDGLGLIDWQFAPHFNSDHSESDDINKEIAYYEEHGMNYKALKDGDVIVIE